MDSIGDSNSNLDETNLDWFAFETKIWKVIAELLEKNIQRSYEDKKSLVMA